MPDLTGQQYQAMTGMGLTDEDINNAGYSYSSSGSAANDIYGDFWAGGNAASDWFGHKDTFAHNEALAAYARESQAAKEAWERESGFNASEAQKQRDFEKMLSDTAFQRNVADYVAAGFSPLAALEGSVGASTPSGAAANASAKLPGTKAAVNGSNGFGGLVGSMIAAVALIATKGMSAVSKAAAASGAAAASAAKSTAQVKDFAKIVNDSYYTDTGELTPAGLKRAEQLVAGEHAKGRKAWSGDDFFDDDSIRKRQSHLRY